MTDLEKKLVKLLRDAEFALNSVPSHGLKHPEYRSTYQLVEVIGKTLREIDA